MIPDTDWPAVIAARYSQPQVLELPVAEPGVCDDCEREAKIRWTVGRFACCSKCSSSRVRARAKAAADLGSSRTDTQQEATNRADKGEV